MKIALAALLLLAPLAASAADACPDYRGRFITAEVAEHLTERAQQLLREQDEATPIHNETALGGLSFIRALGEWATERGGATQSGLRDGGIECITAIRRQVLGW